MRNPNIGSIALAFGLAFSACAMADGMTAQQYKSQKKAITAEYKVARAGCDSLAGNANDICVKTAKGKLSVALAEVKDAYQPTIETGYQVRVARADAAYAVAIQRCDDKAGNAKDVCVEEAKAADVHGMADAKARMTTSDADEAAMRKSADANAAAMAKASDAHRDAAADKRDADYAVAREKCAVFAGDTKEHCLSDAKFRFGPI